MKQPVHFLLRHKNVIKNKFLSSFVHKMFNNINFLNLQRQNVLRFFCFHCRSIFSNDSFVLTIFIYS